MNLTLTRQVLDLATAWKEIADNMFDATLQSVIVRAVTSLVAFFNERCGEVRAIPYGDVLSVICCSKIFA
jgi:hypothetical protein